MSVHSERLAGWRHDLGQSSTSLDQFERGQLKVVAGDHDVTAQHVVQLRTLAADLQGAIDLVGGSESITRV
jgi:hypothetical protein